MPVQPHLAVWFSFAILESERGQLAVAFGTMEARNVVIVATGCNFFGWILREIHTVAVTQNTNRRICVQCLVSYLTTVLLQMAHLMRLFFFFFFFFIVAAVVLDFLPTRFFVAGVCEGADTGTDAGSHELKWLSFDTAKLSIRSATVVSL